MECIYTNIQYNTVQEAIKEAGIILMPKNDTSLLLWRDSLSHLINYSQIQPWQVINRIPLSNVLCRKIPLAVILKEGLKIFPSYFDFFPETYILPQELDLLEKEVIQIREQSLNKARINRKNRMKNIRNQIQDDHKVYDSIKLIKKYSNDSRSKSCNFKKQSKANNNKLYKSDDENYEKDENFEKKDEFLIKPSNGSLGRGIKIIQSGDLIDKYSYCDEIYKKPKNSTKTKQIPAVAQKYIKSHLINNTKFDLRIYVLVSSVEPLEIFVYRDGLARFCSLKSSCKSIFARITNVTMNKNSSFCNQPEKISRLISDVFDECFSEEQQNKIWSEIDDLIVLTLFCSHRYLLKGQEKFLPNSINIKRKNLFYSKCFQIFGFDILLREKDLKPFLIEVNYRPSLEFMRCCERRMKVDMIKDAIKIAAPYESFQKLINARNLSCCSSLWNEEVYDKPELFEKAYELKKETIQQSKYERIWPLNNVKNQKKFEIFSDILKRIDQITIDDQLVIL